MEYQSMEDQPSPQLPNVLIDGRMEHLNIWKCAEKCWNLGISVHFCYATSTSERLCFHSSNREFVSRREAAKKCTRKKFSVIRSFVNAHSGNTGHKLLLRLVIFVSNSKT